MSNYTTVSIPQELADKIKKRIAGTGFRSMSEYTTYVLRQIISSAEIQKENKAFTKEDKKEIERRLKYLGYV